MIGNRFSNNVKNTKTYSGTKPVVVKTHTQNKQYRLHQGQVSSESKQRKSNNGWQMKSWTKLCKEENSNMYITRQRQMCKADKETWWHYTKC